MRFFHQFNQLNNRPQVCPEPVNRQVFDCGGQQTVIRHQHVVKHRHNIINEYDVVHEHDYNHFDVVRQRNVVRHNDCTTHRPNYCCPSNNDEMQSRHDHHNFVADDNN